MLNLVFGGAGTGKSEYILKQVSECVQNGKKAILLVPEQSSFETEKALYRLFGAKSALMVEVLSFTRLCDYIFRSLGGLAGVHMDETAKLLLMSVSISNVSHELRAYKKNSESSTFARTMCETIGELKMAGATSEILLKAAHNEENVHFRDKLFDISLTFEAFQTLVECGYDDPDDHPRRACSLLEGTDFFSSQEVFVDGFMAFTGAEWRMLALILESSPSVTVSLPCCDANDAGQMGPFAAGAGTAQRLILIAEKVGCKISENIILDKPLRYQNPALAYLSIALAQQCPKQYNGQVNDIFTICAEDCYDELSYVAGQICSLVRNGYRYREIAIIARGIDRYTVPLQSVFEKYGIPYFTDKRVDIEMYPLINGLLCALEAVCGGFETQKLLSLSKSCISGIDCVDAAMLENYCFLWNIRGKIWKSDFLNHPDGMEQEFTDEQAQRLARINSSRKCLIEPLIRLQSAISDCNGREFAKAVFNYLENIEASKRLLNVSEKMEFTDSKHFIELGAQIWDALIGVLDVFGGALADTRFSPTRMSELLRMSLSSIDIGLLPQTLDQVLVGSADRIRPNHVRAVFVIGANEGEFPRWESPTGIFSSLERGSLKEYGIDLLRTPDQQALFEKYYVYFAMTQASERLWLTCPLRDSSGGSLSTASIFGQLSDLLQLKIGSTAETELFSRAVNERTAFALLARCWNAPSQERETLKNYFEDEHPERLNILERLAGNRSFSLTDKAAARKIFGNEMHVSPSRVERYYTCPFSYFCQTGLKLKPRRRVQFDPLEAGSLIHLVLEKTVRKYGGKGIAKLEESVLRTEVSELIREELTKKIQDFENMPERFKYLFSRLVNTLTRLLIRLGIEFSQSRYEPAAFELPINANGPVSPLSVMAEDGSTVIAEGVVDRVDIMEKDGKRYIRVVDYKSGKKDFSLSDVYNGLNLQMLIYLFALCRAPSPKELENIPAGVLYMPARDAMITATRETGLDEIKKEQQKQLRMNGLLLDDIESLSGMEENMAGVFIPAVRKKDGTIDARRSLATMEQMGAVKRRVEELLALLAQKLHEGEIEAAPARHADDIFLPCAYCDFHPICGHEESDNFRDIVKTDMENTMKDIMEEAKNNGRQEVDRAAKSSD